MKKIVSLIMIIVFLTMIVGCAAHVHTVGKGAQAGNKIENRQWYALWGLIPINQVDTKAIAGDKKDYEIKTEQSAIDIVMNIFTSIVTVYSRTVTVTK